MATRCSMWPYFILLLAAQSSAASSQANRGAKLPQDDQAAVRVPREAGELKLTGRVLGPDARPFAGAVVLSSAGGKAVSGPDGMFELALEPNPRLGSLRLTAVAGGTSQGTLVASRSLPPPAARGATSVGDLQLAAGASCEPSWLPTFGSLPGLDGVVRALAVFDDGQGPALYVGGSFSVADGLFSEYLAKWDGSSWSALSSPPLSIGSGVRCLAVFDDGTGEALYVGGSFGVMGVWARIARWDGSSWSLLGSGVNGTVLAMTVLEGPSSSALYVGGQFTVAGGVPANRVARWDGASWSALGNGTNNTVEALAVFDDGGGPALYVGGWFGVVGDDQFASRVAKWDGTSWSALGPGVGSTVRALIAFDDGGGSALYVGGGSFSGAGGVVKWDGSTWSTLAGGTSPNGVDVLAVFDDGGGPALFVGGNFQTAGGMPANRIARWDGSSWSALGDGIHPGGYVLALAFFSAGTPSATLFAAGSFGMAGDQGVRSIASWDGTSWERLGTGLHNQVYALEVFDDGSGPALYAGGWFLTAEPVIAHFARWNGVSWSVVGGAFNGPVYCLTLHDDGTGTSLYAGGPFTQIGGSPAGQVARWDGSSWTSLGQFSGGVVYNLTSFDDGSGPRLYAAGTFTIAGGLPALRVASWDGVSWSPLGSGMNNIVSALAGYDDGNGAALYAGGNFTVAGGQAINRLARWDGSSWSSVSPGGMDYGIAELLAYDDGSGSALYAGGAFFHAGGVFSPRFARWNGSTWSSIGGGFPGPGGVQSVRVIRIYDDGSGPALLAGVRGYNNSAKTWEGVYRWDGTSWTGLGMGVEDRILALAGYDDGSGPMLYVGGSFKVSAGGDCFIARFGGCTPSAAYCFGAACPCSNTGGVAQGCANSTGQGGVLATAGSMSVQLDDLALSASNVMPSQPTLLFAGESSVNGGLGVAFGDGLRCVAGNVLRLGVATADAQGTVAWGPGLAAAGGWSPGDTRRFQAWYRDHAGPCGNGFNLTHAVEATFVP